MKQTVQQIYSQARQLLGNSDQTRAVTGEDFDRRLSQTVIYHTLSLPANGGGRFEINLTTANARPTFEWLAEITHYDDAGGSYKHYLVQPGYKIVEAYGRKLLDVDQAGATALLGQLQQLSL